MLIPRASPPVRTSEMEREASPAPRGAMAILAFAFTATWFVTTATAAHLPRLLEIAGARTRQRLAPLSWLDPRRLRPGWSNSGRCAWCTRWFQRGSPLCCIRLKLVAARLALRNTPHASCCGIAKRHGWAAIGFHLLGGIIWPRYWVLKVREGGIRSKITPATIGLGKLGIGFELLVYDHDAGGPMTGQQGRRSRDLG
jgi:hypothetical protein